ncbi:class I SAM-dependent methyltransferase [Actinoplanes subtropicus]|uniref:class I SAM-dependent methyltransferase n=1 Tax=Actinoplanes subtropicus TaxID=543632 RepID=UPI000690AF4F|nr:class I SAM-dependent methyltransferase [Actinoplanes subtropicus]
MTTADRAASAFPWRGRTYDAEYRHVISSGESLIDLLAPRIGERILDLGCGTGTITAQIAQRGAIARGFDISESMISQARRQYPDVRFDLGDAGALPADSTHDAVFCNSALHWMDALTDVFGAVFSALTPGGRFVAEVPVVGSLAELRELLLRAWAKAEIPGSPPPTRWHLRDPQEYLAKLVEARFTVTSAEVGRRERQLNGVSPRQWWSQYGPEVFRGLSDSQRGRINSALDDLTPPEVRCDSVLLRFLAHRSRDGETAV